ncbi:MAG TPA: hypothetical protein VHC22_16200 [Pirellulales bacterium]|nr:hypothetical protein [Pirellulales bacterium]
MTDDYELREAKGKIVTIAPLEVVYRYVKHECKDGIYSVKGPMLDGGAVGEPLTDGTLEGRGGTVYPTSGTFEGKRIKPRTLDEAHRRFVGGDETA